MFVHIAGIIILIAYRHVLLTVLGVDSFLMRTESGGAWCNACGHMANNYRDVARHIESRHLNLKIQCRFCPMVCSTRRNLQRHLKSKHIGHATKNMDTAQSRKYMEELMRYHFDE